MTDTNPGPFGPDLIMALEDAGIIPRHTQRIIIEADLKSFVTIHAMLHPQNGNKVIEVLRTSLAGAQVIIYNAADVKEQIDQT